jgi:minichromosome maintenance protein 10
MKDGEKFTGDKDGRQVSPVRKKTRFVTEKGIREAGRESLGAELSKRVELDDDDELVII